jgi:F-type H+-transporting ATPase subunit delta
MTGASASHYARALADAVIPPDSGVDPRKAIEQLRSAEDFLSSSKDVQLVLASPLVSKNEKLNLVRQLADRLGLHWTVRNFLLIVASHRRAGDIRRIRSQFEQIIDERLRLTAVQVISARELSPARKSEIEQVFTEKFGNEIQVEYKTDSSLIGGVKAFVAAKECDATIRGGLERLRSQLLTST